MSRGDRGGVWFRWCAVLFSGLCILFFFHSIAGYYEILRTECVLRSCSSLAPAPPTTVEALADVHLTPDLYALAFVLIECVFACVFYIAAFLLFLKSRQGMMGSLAVLALITYGTTYTALVYLGSGSGTFAQIPEIISAIGWMSISLFFLLFPDGRLTHRWTIYIYIPFCLVQLTSLLFPHTRFELVNWPSTARLVYYMIMIVTIAYSQIVQYKKRSNAIQRQQTKWVVYGFAFSFIGSMLFGGVFVYPVFSSGPASYLYMSIGLYAIACVFPITLSFAILRHRLWDIDPLVNRTIVYGTLSLCIILLYAVLVLYFSSLFDTEQNFIISLVATGIIAVLFAPLKNKLQLLVNRLMKGRHDDPYSVIKELGDRLIKPIAPDTVLTAVIESIRKALRVPYAGIAVGVNGNETMAAESGKTRFDLCSFPILHGGEELGSLLLSSRSRDEAFTGEDEKLIHFLVRQIGPIVQNVKITLGMRLLAEDLQHSRERLVVAREEERLQIRKNLHDDLAPKLLSLSFNVAAAEQYIENNPRKAIELLAGLRQTIRTTVDEIRTMVHGLRPPTLDELGLIGSIRARLNDIGQTSEPLAAALHIQPLTTELEAPDRLPPLPAAAEVAAYRIVTESLVNVIRHSKATRCKVRIDLLNDNELLVEITDNGIGLPGKARPAENGGIGLTSIRERAHELGGSCSIENIQPGGARVKAIIPI